MDGAALPALPGDLDIEGARLPATYEAARHALAECVQLDECREWAAKAEALASYARQMNDDALRVMCEQILARAIRRAGELLQEIEPAHGARTDLQPNDAADIRLTRTQAAQDAGLSDRQRVTALRVASVPRDEFETAVEGTKPATVTELAERGTRHREPSRDHLHGLRVFLLWVFSGSVFFFTTFRASGL
jgi:hypothetical protein